MSQETENFEPLRRLLALKRYEQPPPRYFGDFSRQVVMRIKAGDRGESHASLEQLLWEAPWLQRFWAAFEGKPAMAGVLGVVVCGLLLSGMLYAERADVSPITLVPVTEAQAAPMSLANASEAAHPLLVQPTLLEPSSTNPIATLGIEASLLGDIGQLRAQPASLTFQGRN